MGSDSFYSKAEQGKPNHVLSSDRQVRLKVFYATKLGVNSTEDYQKIILTTQDRPAPTFGELVKFTKGIQPELDGLVESFRISHQPKKAKLK